MKQAYISLDAEVANAYMNVPLKQRKKLDYMINSWLKNIFYRIKDPKEKLFETMNSISMDAQKNGLTPEILEQILWDIKQEKQNAKK